MTWENVLQIMALMTWASIMASPWSPRARARALDRTWEEVNKNGRR